MEEEGKRDEGALWCGCLDNGGRGWHLVLGYWQYLPLTSLDLRAGWGDGCREMQQFWCLSFSCQEPQQPSNRPQPSLPLALSSSLPFWFISPRACGQNHVFFNSSLIVPTHVTTEELGPQIKSLWPCSKPTIKKWQNYLFERLLINLCLFYYLFDVFLTANFCSLNSFCPKSRSTNKEYAPVW